MSTNELRNLPKHVLEKSLKLRNAVRTIYLKLYCCEEGKSAEEVALMVGHARPYVAMRLNQLVDMGYVKRYVKGRTKFFEAIK